MKQTRSLAIYLPFVMSIAVLLAVHSTSAAGDLDRSGRLYAPYLEWSLNNPSWSGNAFDVEATATFTHEATGKEVRTPMFFDNDATWKFRFTATRTGTWALNTSSDDADLDGHQGTVTVEAKPAPDVKGFIVAHENKYAWQAGENGELEGLVPNIYMNYRKYGKQHQCGWTDVSRTFGDPDVLQAYLDEAEEHGCNAIQALIGNQWFQADAASSRDHESENPDPKTFEALEQAIRAAHQRRMHLHIWAWGDEARGWTPVGVGGIDGAADLRLQHYLAARLGPLPGWTMSYGFDLNEWVTTDQVSRWHEHLQQEMGSEDFGMYRMDGVKAFMFLLGSVSKERLAVTDTPSPLHSPTYHPDIRPTLAIGIRSMCASAMHLLPPDG